MDAAGVHHLARNLRRGAHRDRPARTRLPGTALMAALPDYQGDVAFTYEPHPDGLADPGEIVWTWVPYEDDPNQGKDRPVLVIAHLGQLLLGLMLTSKDHDRDAADEARYGRHWLDIGAGDWDPKRRPSEIRLDRVLTLDPAVVRREGAALDQARFDEVEAAFRELDR
ncbi:MAG: type II toxin-antitoxin system PemK/MazF family toxin [Jatrophihabitans sp.]